ncbi:hypothetical protein E2C01_074121 [Portunus trituberculatus]|uniref:Uncharacterized protein n=1 Tax=Portunus trituberculatus TaxID=210409 RepID=A0A5B7ICF2_PORTR|nr:hypothetical protein [Portunus trituberculatus]
MATFAVRGPDGFCGHIYSGTKSNEGGARRGGQGRRRRRRRGGVHFINKHKRRIFRKIMTLSDESEAVEIARVFLMGALSLTLPANPASLRLLRPVVTPEEGRGTTAMKVFARE